MYRIKETTDGKYTGKEFELTTSPVIITDEFTFNYEKKIETRTELVLANSNYVILSELLEDSQ